MFAKRVECAIPWSYAALLSDWVHQSQNWQPRPTPVAHRVRGLMKARQDRLQVPVRYERSDLRSRAPRPIQSRPLQRTGCDHEHCRQQFSGEPCRPTPFARARAPPWEKGGSSWNPVTRSARKDRPTPIRILRRGRVRAFADWFELRIGQNFVTQDRKTIATESQLGGFLGRGLFCA
jgi:hypothetical protein